MRMYSHLNQVSSLKVYRCKSVEIDCHVCFLYRMSYCHIRRCSSHTFLLHDFSAHTESQTSTGMHSFKSFFVVLRFTGVTVMKLSIMNDFYAECYPPELGASLHKFLLQALSVHNVSQELECIFLNTGFTSFKVYRNKFVQSGNKFV